MNNLTIFRIGGIGDMCLIVPMLREIREQFPQTKIHLYGHIGMANLLVKAGLADFADKQSSRYQKDDRIYNGLLEIVGLLGMDYPDEWQRKITATFGDPDLFICFSPDPVRASFGLEMMGIPKFVVNLNTPPPSTHQADFCMLALRNAGILSKWRARDSIKPVTMPLKKEVRTASDSTAILHPGSGLKWKNWPVKNYIELANKLNHHGYDVVILEGPEEHGMADRFEDKYKVIRSTSLEDLAYFMSSQPVFFGNDSGITHLASILGCPTVAIFGPTLPDEWGPIGVNSHYVRNCPKEATGSVRVCYKPDCMNSVSVEEVWNAFELVLEGE